METNALFIQLLRIALRGSGRLSHAPSSAEWEKILELSAKQSVVGIAFSGVEILPKEQMPSLDIIMEWAAVTHCIENENRKLNALCVKVCQIFHQEGINACILKGQGIATHYPLPLRRMSGDIDVWMEGDRERVMSYVKRNFRQTEGEGLGHHIAVTLHKGTVDMEVHWQPLEMYCPRNDHRVGQWVRTLEPHQWSHSTSLPEGIGDINVPTSQFNTVFILLHLFHHWAFEGCGMKQILDYYFLLQSPSFAPSTDSLKLIHDIGLDRFLSAMMWIMQELGMSDAHLLCPPDEKYGRRLLDEILAIGTVSADDLLNGTYGQEGKIHKMLRRFRRSIRMAPYAPREMHHMFWNNIYAYLRGRTR